MELCGREFAGNFAWNCDFHINSGIFYMPRICDMGPMALLPFQRKACWGIFCPERSSRLRAGLNPRTCVLKGSTLPLDHRSRLRWVVSFTHQLVYRQGKGTQHPSNRKQKRVVVKITMTYIYKGRVPSVVKCVDRTHCQMKSQKKRRTFSGQPTSIPENTLFTTCAK